LLPPPLARTWAGVVGRPVDNEYLLEEVRLNRAEARADTAVLREDVGNLRAAQGGKVSWGGLLSVLSMIGMVIGVVIMVL
jgi:hypothetical protein